MLVSGGFAAACGGGHDVDPRVISGGGVGDPDIDGEVNIYVIDTADESPIQGATVYVGDAPIMGTTDADGLFVAKGSLSGPQDITVVADTYTTGTWYGANGANVTMPLSVSVTPTNIPSATLTGTITGWDSMQPPSGEALIAFVATSASNDDNDPGNNLTQPGGMANLCVKSQLNPTAPCDWSVLTRVGKQQVYALIGHAPPSSNPVITFTDYAYMGGITVVDGVDQSSIALTMASAGDIQPVDVSLPSAPSGTDTVDAIARINLGDDGRVQVPLTGGFVGSMVMPKTSVFSGSTLDLVGFASSTSNSDAQSVRIDRDASASGSIGEMMRLPTGMSTDGTTFSFDQVAGASLQTFDVKNANGDKVWSAATLDGSISVTRPDPVVLPSGSLTFVVSGIEVPTVDLQDFAINDVLDTVSRIGADGVTFTN